VDRLLARGVPDVHGVLSQIFERILISRALAHTGGRRIEAAQALGIGRNTITRKLPNSASRAARTLRRSKICRMALLDPVLLKSRLGLLAGRFDVDALDECDSTNSELMRRAESGAPSGTVIVADRQTAGRGRRGRSWLSRLNPV
jgi:hypothetical protein